MMKRYFKLINIPHLIFFISILIVISNFPTAQSMMRNVVEDEDKGVQQGSPGYFAGKAKLAATSFISSIIDTLPPFAKRHQKIRAKEALREKKLENCDAYDIVCALVDYDLWLPTSEFTLEHAEALTSLPTIWDDLGYKNKHKADFSKIDLQKYKKEERMALFCTLLTVRENLENLWDPTFTPDLLLALARLPNRYTRTHLVMLELRQLYPLPIFLTKQKKAAVARAIIALANIVDPIERENALNERLGK